MHAVITMSACQHALEVCLRRKTFAICVGWVARPIYESYVLGHVKAVAPLCIVLVYTCLLFLPLDAYDCPGIRHIMVFRVPVSKLVRLHLCRIIFR